MRSKRGVAPEIIGRALATFPGALERMERIAAGQPYMVMVDYAHTAASLEKTMIVVFGSARDGKQFTCIAS
ncbi:MAG TPA: cyanophycin synthetase [Ktedonobacterales bacterium]|nr:cyanophycin synthetase [Ktedonobacterales bacterium]